MSFGAMVKELRIAKDKTLRQFCREHGYDPSNWSKLERGVLAPAKDEKILAQWAKHLGLVPDTEAWRTFVYEASVAQGRIPAELLSDKKIVEQLPVFFRTVRGAELGEAELKDLIRKIKEAHSPG
jgi:transcriptional regulator with XRE-family HTH domain